MFWNDRQRLDGIARGIRGTGWGVAILILVIGTVIADRGDGQLALLHRAILAAVVLAVAHATAWWVDRYAERAATR